MHHRFVSYLLYALMVIILGVGVLGAAVFYRSPEAMEKKMENAVASAPIWHMEISGEAEGGRLRVDLVKRPEQEFLRVSYPPLKILNNQWVEIFGGPSSGVPEDGPLHIFASVHLTRRLTTLRDIFARRERYGFVFDEKTREAFLSMLPEGGELTMDARSGLPLKLNAAQLHASVIYNDPLANQTVHTRSLDDVLAQLTEVAKAQNGKPKKITPLTQNREDVSAFAEDFDRDGLSDALEIFYGTDVANPDTDNDAFLDGDEVERGFSPTGAGRLN